MDEPLWTFEEISAATGAPLRASGVASGVSIDSRTLEAGDLFVAIKGEHADGHKFVEAAFERGASAAIVEAGYEGITPHPVPLPMGEGTPAQRARPDSLSHGERAGVRGDSPVTGCDPTSTAALFRTPDTLEALNALARAARQRANATVAAVTGSAGKTGTKEMLRVMLAQSGPTHASEKSYNNLWGVPLSLARMPRNARFGVFEIGMNHAGEITPLTRLVRPHIAIVTWIAPVHIEFFSSTADIADAKAEIFEGLEQGGAAILPESNEHFERLAAHARQHGATVIPFGEGAKGGACLLQFEPQAAGSKVTADILGSNIAFWLGVPGRHLAMNAIAALAAVKLMGGELEAAAAALASFEAPEGRGRRARFETPEGAVLIIDETYNANPASIAAALGVLGAIPRAEHPRRIAVLGDMLELGNAGPQYHAGLKAAVDSDDIDLVFCAGPLMAHLYAVLPEHKRGRLAGSAEELLPAVLEAVRGGDAVTVKGSLGSRMGPLAEALRLNLSTPPSGKDSGNASLGVGT
ncbi:MAG: UDP-N-acetylmuramoyl-tripeptide--D-alanyl-D-alanine ligase [Rhodomicrobium sp.]